MLVTEYLYNLTLSQRHFTNHRQLECKYFTTDEYKCMHDMYDMYECKYFTTDEHNGNPLFRSKFFFFLTFNYKKVPEKNIFQLSP